MTTLDDCIFMKDTANEDESYNLRCVTCENKVFYVESDKALLPGHIYSEAGGREYKITRMCEFCFDGITLPDDDEEMDCG